MGGKGFQAGKLPEKKEGEGWVAPGWGRFKRAVGMETPGGKAVHLPDSCYDRVGRDGVRIPRIKYSYPSAITQAGDFARAVPMMVQAAAAKTIELAKAKVEEVAKNRRA